MNIYYIYGNGEHSKKRKHDFPLELKNTFEELAECITLEQYLYLPDLSKRAREIEKELGLTFSYRSIALLSNKIRVYR